MIITSAERFLNVFEQRCVRTFLKRYNNVRYQINFVVFLKTLKTSCFRKIYVVYLIFVIDIRNVGRTLYERLCRTLHANVATTFAHGLFTFERFSNNNDVRYQIHFVVFLKTLKTSCFRKIYVLYLIFVIDIRNVRRTLYERLWRTLHPNVATTFAHGL